MIKLVLAISCLLILESCSMLVLVKDCHQVSDDPENHSMCKYESRWAK